MNEILIANGAEDKKIDYVKYINDAIAKAQKHAPSVKPMLSPWSGDMAKQVTEKEKCDRFISNTEVFQKQQYARWGILEM